VRGETGISLAAAQRGAQGYFQTPGNNFINCHHSLWYKYVADRATAQAVSRWLLTAAILFRANASIDEICGDKVAMGQVFSEYFSFPRQSFNQLLPLIMFHPTPRNYQI
jgi:hypothetical protein